MLRSAATTAQKVLKSTTAEVAAVEEEDVLNSMGSLSSTTVTTDDDVRWWWCRCDDRRVRADGVPAGLLMGVEAAATAAAAAAAAAGDVSLPLPSMGGDAWYRKLVPALGWKGLWCPLCRPAAVPWGTWVGSAVAEPACLATAGCSTGVLALLRIEPSRDLLSLGRGTGVGWVG